MGYILGLSFFYHDSAACLLHDGMLEAAIEEEKFTRKKHDSGFPSNAIRYCLKEGGVGAGDLEAVVFYEKPFLKLERVMNSSFQIAPFGASAFAHAAINLLTKKIWIEDLIRKELKYDGKIYFTEHHQSHAACCFYPSPFKSAAILTLDGSGEWATTTKALGANNEVQIIKEIHFPHSLGLLYSAFTQYLGFRVNSGEYKVMGLAPNGKPKYADVIREKLIRIHGDGAFSLNMDYFGYLTGLEMINRRFEGLFGRPARKSETKLDDFHADVARSLQDVTEEVVLKLANSLRDETGEKYLCMAGGVALNCVANGKVLRESGFDDLYVFPAAGDAGGCVGASALVYHAVKGGPRCRTMENAYLGPEYSHAEVKSYLQSVNAVFREMPEKDLLDRTSQDMKDKKVVGWYQGRLEFGPRALGGRSIVADPTYPDMKDMLNQRIKLREGFRPFAPTVQEDKASIYFELDRPSPFMLLVAQVRENYRKKLPAITHVDGSARIQTVSRKENRLYYDLISAFAEKRGIAVIVNTSFNVRGEPIVNTPRNAYECFMRTGMDRLVMGNLFLEKEEQPEIEVAPIKELD